MLQIPPKFDTDITKGQGTRCVKKVNFIEVFPLNYGTQKISIHSLIMR